MTYFSKYDFTLDNLEIACESRWTDEEVQHLVREIFEAFSKNVMSVQSLANQTKLKASFSKRTEGQSPAEVYELTFSKLNGDRALASFIIRAHLDARADASAERERQLVRDINSSGSDRFSSTLIEPINSIPNLVVYRHADDQLSESSQLLRDGLLEALSAADDQVVHRLARELNKLSLDVIRTYEDFQPTPHTLVSGDQYFERVRSRLIPDLIINAYDRNIVVGEGELRVLTETGNIYGDRQIIVSQSAAELVESLLRNDNLPQQWVSIKAWPRAPSVGTGGYLRFEANNKRIWLRVDQTKYNEIQLEQEWHEIVFYCEGEIALPGTNQLERLGFTRDALISTTSFGELCQGLDERLEEGYRHTDLHCRNILVASERMKVIDLASADPDLLFVSQARLEISIWYELTSRMKLDVENTERILANLAGDVEPSQSSLTWNAWALNVILLALRRGMGDASVVKSGIGVSLAYATQVLLHERYALENNLRASDAFNAVASFWVRQVERLTVSETSLLQNSSTEGTDEVQSLPEDKVNENWSTLYSLWEEALRSRTLALIEPRAKALLEAIANENGVFLQSALTDLQRVILDGCKESRPFQSNLHVLLAAPTSSGKSTVAEMFLAGPSMLNTRRTCALYIAPTRALTQAKYRDLRRLFAGDEEMFDGIVLSTGEDEDDDWRINHGQFTIACMVYEKANILFSQNRRLISRLGCIVIDELHMLMDLERGPILEMVLTKAILERLRIDAHSSRGPNEETIRIVAISTEDIPDRASEQFLSVQDPDTGNSIRPLLFHDSHRPVKVQHVLVLAGKDDSPYSKFPIVEFTSTESRTLSDQAVEDLGRRLLAEGKGAQVRNFSTRLGPAIEVGTRLESLLLDLLLENPSGYRVLVFVPSRTEAEQAAGRLKNRLTKKTKGTRLERFGTRFRHEDIIGRLKPLLDNAEDQRKAEVVRTCAAAGIFIHHSDIDKKIRREIENICSTMPPSTPSQVVFATETLSYGVNLAIHDVVLWGIDFRSQTRFREPSVEMLSTSAFHNMVGRAGRLGKTRGDAHVYIMVPQNTDTLGIIKNYYVTIKPAQSKIYVRDDRAVQLRAETSPFRQLIKKAEGSAEDDCWVYGTLGAQDFSYPFVRSILDALRHLNISDGETKSGVRSEMLLELFGHTLYAGQFWKTSDTEELHRFICALKRILDDCTKGTLRLVEATEGETKWYTLTPRGEAIIDTGTEIDTVEPLLAMVASVHEVWKTLHGNQPFPTELYVLCLVSQKEVYRQSIYYAPECKGRDLEKNWPEPVALTNRQKVFDSFARAIEKIEAFTTAEAEVLAENLRSILDKWEPIHSINAAYPFGSSDSLLRIFAAIIAWINLEDRSIVDRMIEGPELPEAFRGRLQGFRQFTDLLNIKTLFLSRMLATDKKAEELFGPDDERNLHLLAQRLRLGCTAEAIPLFWPFSSDVLRKQAKKFVSYGLTPSRILSSGDPHRLVEKSVDIPPEKLDRLREDLERFAKKEFSELQAEMTLADIYDQSVKRQSLRKLWERLDLLFPKSIDQFRESDKAVIDFDGLLRDCLNFAKSSDVGNEPEAFHLTSAGRSAYSDRYRVRIDFPLPNSGMIWVGERLISVDAYEEISDVNSKAQQERKYEKQVTLRIIGAQFNKNWDCSVGTGRWQPFVNFLKDEQRTRHLVIVPFPWTPSREELSDDLKKVFEQRGSIAEFSTTFVTPAAFAVIVSSLIRDFISSELCMKLLTETPKSHQLFSVVAVKQVQEVLDKTPNRPLVATIREKLLRHFEVDV